MVRHSHILSYNEPSRSEIESAHRKAVGGKRPRCNIGKSCSAACITRSDFCLVELAPGPSSSLTRLKDVLDSMDRAGQGDIHKKILLDMVKESDSLKKKLPALIRDGDQKKYEEIQARIKEISDTTHIFTKKHSEERVIKIPASWDKVQQAYDSYLRASDSLRSDMGSAAKSNKRKAYDRAERKLQMLQERLGQRLGFEGTVVKGEAWRQIRQMLKDPALKSLGLSSKDVPKMWWIIQERLRNPFLGNNFDSNPVRVHNLLREQPNKVLGEGRVIRGTAHVDYLDGGQKRALRDYTKNGYHYIRKAQAGKIPEKMGEKFIKKMLRDASRIEELLKDLPKPPVEKYRGKLASDDELARLIGDTKKKKGFSMAAMSSWSNSWEIGKKFADAEPTTGSDRVNRVFFRTVNKRGSPIGPLSHHSYENEILTPSNTNFRYSRYSTHTDKDGNVYHIFDVEEL